jgi:hypothetical protein
MIQRYLSVTEILVLGRRDDAELLGRVQVVDETFEVTLLGFGARPVSANQAGDEEDHEEQGEADDASEHVLVVLFVFCLEKRIFCFA